jgi:2-oxoglutarate ferredoxin oxidoreductase subunit alpha
MDDKARVRNNLCWKIGGPAGFGIAVAGTMLAKACMRAGLNAFMVSENPSLIRGGHNHVTVHVRDREVHSHLARIDLLVALDQMTADTHAKNVAHGGGIIYDPEEVETGKGPGVNLFKVPIKKLCEARGGLMMRNTVAIGATAGLLDFDTGFTESVMRDAFARKGGKVIDMNIEALKAGYGYAKENYPGGSGFILEKGKAPGSILVSGNEAVALGAIKAGCKFMSAYPMTPATGVMETMARFAGQFGLVVRQVEDEIAAINMAIGASFAGARAMTATSGGGFCLMTEGLGLAMQTETPLVVVECQRPGPATGMATRTGQGDLRFVLHASTDDSPRFVIAPGDMEEAFSLTVKAFDLAERYQMPAILLLDKFLGMSYATVPAFKADEPVRRHIPSDREAARFKDYKRYAHTDGVVSPRTVPGQKGGTFWASSYEHMEEGHECEDKENRVWMARKRFLKLALAAKDIPAPRLYGTGGADITIIGWGSTKGPVREGMLMLEGKGAKASHLHVNFISPFPKEAVAKAIKQAGKTLVVENNQSGQLAGLIKQETGLDVDYTLLKYDGRPFFPEEICKHTLKIMGGR